MASHDFKEVLPKTGLLHHEATYNFVLCKPKIMPLKSITLEKLEKMQKEAQELVRDQVRFRTGVREWRGTEGLGMLSGSGEGGKGCSGVTRGGGDWGAVGRVTL